MPMIIALRAAVATVAATARIRCGCDEPRFAAFADITLAVIGEPLARLAALAVIAVQAASTAAVAAAHFITLCTCDRDHGRHKYPLNLRATLHVSPLYIYAISYTRLPSPAHFPLDMR